MPTIADHQRKFQQAEQALSAWGDQAPVLLERLEAEGIRSVADWRALGRRRFRIFGITRSMAAQLDELARGAP
jgi:hypothetical protein